MTLAFDSYADVAEGADFTPVGTARAILFFVLDNGGSTDTITGVTLEGIPMTEVALSPLIFTASSEDAVLYCYFLGSGIPAGGLTLDIDGTPTGGSLVAFTAAGDCEVLDTSTASQVSASNPSVSVTGDTVNGAFGVALLQSGLGTASQLTPDSGNTQLYETDFGAQLGSLIRKTSLSTSNPITLSWTAVASSYAVLGVSIREIVSVTGTVNQVTETDLAQPVAWAPKHRLANQALETDLAQGIAAQTSSVVGVLQASETDLAQALTVRRSRTLGQASETDLAQDLNSAKVRAIAQANETDLAQAINVADLGEPVGQASETDLAQPISVVPVAHQVFETDRAQQIAVVGGVLVVSDAPVLIRAPRKAGRIFHEIVGPSGEGFHPSIAEWEAEEDAPGGFRGAKGLISSRTFHAHRDAFHQGSLWRTFLEDGTCIFAGRVKQIDPEGTVVALSAVGRAAIADREVGPILYQAHVGSEVSEGFFDSDRWRASVKTMTHSFGDTEIQFDRNEGATESGNATMVIPYFGRDLAYMRMHMQGSWSFIAVLTAQRERVPNLTNSSELDVSNSSYENWFFNLGSGLNAGNVEIDLVLASGALSYPNTTAYTNEGDIDDTGWGFVWPNIIFITVGDWDPTVANAAAANLILSNIEINGSALGSRRRYSVGDLVEDIAARLGFRDVNVGGAYDITPYELPPGVPAAEALEWACLISGKRYRILDTGSRADFQFGRWDEHQWALASPWSPLHTIPEERYDSVVVPYEYPGTHGQLTDQVIVRVDDSPLLRKRVNWEFSLGQPAHNRDKALDLAAQLADDLVRPRFTGDFAAAEVLGPDGEKLSAHHINAGDILQPWRREEPGRLRIGRLTRFDDHVEGEFDGENKAVDQLIARREKRISDRNR